MSWTLGWENLHGGLIHDLLKIETEDETPLSFLVSQSDRLVADLKILQRS